MHNGRVIGAVDALLALGKLRDEPQWAYQPFTAYLIRSSPTLSLLFYPLTRINNTCIPDFIACAINQPIARHPMMTRPVQPSDATEWLRLRMALWPDSTPQEEADEIAHFLAVPPRDPLPTLHAAFVCQRPEGGLCGVAEVSIHHQAPGCTTNRIGYLEAWYVDPDVRGQRVGRALAQAAEDWAREQGCREMASDTDPSYPISPLAHAALGYQEVARSFRKDLA